MLSDCFISWLCMHVLGLILRKIFSANFSLSFAFSVWSVRTASFGVRYGVAQSAGRLCYTFRRVRLRRPDGKVTRPDACSLSACLRGNACPDGSMSRPDGDPTTFIKLGCRISEATPQLHFLFCLLVSVFLWVFALSRPLLSFRALLSHSRYFSS